MSHLDHSQPNDPHRDDAASSLRGDSTGSAAVPELPSPNLENTAGAMIWLTLLCVVFGGMFVGITVLSNWLQGTASSPWFAFILGVIVFLLMQVLLNLER